MDIDNIRSLIELMEEKDLVNLAISSGDDQVNLTRHYEPPAPTVMAAPQAAAAVPAASGESSNAATPVAGETETAPMVGVFYTAPSPNDPPFVKVGQTVKAGDTLGIIEAMKIMNPLEATQSGVVAEVLVNNEDVVQFGQPIVRYQA